MAFVFIPAKNGLSLRYGIIYYSCHPGRLRPTIYPKKPEGSQGGEANITSYRGYSSSVLDCFVLTALAKTAEVNFSVAFYYRKEGWIPD